jgi:hypothetical protein
MIGAVEIAATPRSGAREATMPRYVRRSRKKGYRAPPGVIYCGRPTVRGNPFDWRRFGIARSVRLYEQWFDGKLGPIRLHYLGFSDAEIDALIRWRRRLLEELPRLRGHDLSCWCTENAPFCHVINVLLPRANALGARG